MEGAARLARGLSTIRSGSKVNIIIGLPSEISDDQLFVIEDKLIEGGLNLLAPVEAGSTATIPHAIRIQASIPKGLAFPLAIIIIGAIAAAGFAMITAFGAKHVLDSLARYIVPVTLIATGGLVLYGYATRKK